MGRKSKSSTTQQTSTTTNPIVPQWSLDTVTGLNSAIQKIGGTDPYSYVPQANQLQTGAREGALNYDPSKLFKDLPSVSGESLLTGLDKYMNPYLQQVVDTSLSGFDENAGRVRAQQAAQGAQGAFRGSRFGVREATTEELLSDQRIAKEAGLRSDAFNTATGLSSQDAARRQAASEANAANAFARAQAQASAEANRIGLLSGLGQQQYEQEKERLQSPLDLLKTQVGLFAGLSPESYFGQQSSGTSTSNTTTKQGMDPMAAIGNAIKVAAIFASDRRLKTDVRKVGEDAQGRAWYDYRYIWDWPGVTRRGVMAQDLLANEPERVHLMSNGYYAVDYAGLEPI